MSKSARFILKIWKSLEGKIAGGKLCIQSKLVGIIGELLELLCFYKNTKMFSQMRVSYLIDSRNKSHRYTEPGKVLC